ncbi:SRPBCC domain-containing protein [Streptomyces spiramenti]|uniref:ATPase n=1 Tax=Streptomyces spiramenti TaxID=2720606 RepID=A0ABX1AJ20_9ACTN|nr:SRPBCC domain-containing protein [Streptomyces spiramenti]NJP65100.1 ATPase [Streptomyces spiramenti]
MSSHVDRHGTAVVSLPSDRGIRIVRRFDAPAAELYRAWTTPGPVRRWWGLASASWRVCEIDAREGGTWRYVTHEPGEGADGHDVAVHGEFRELRPPHLLVTTEIHESVPESAALDTVQFDEDGRGVTTLTLDVLHERPAHRDAQLAAGMEDGMQVSLDRLEDLVTAGPDRPHLPPPAAAPPG